MQDTDYAARHAGAPATEIVRTFYYQGRRWIAGVRITPGAIEHASSLFWSGKTYSRTVRQRVAGCGRLYCFQCGEEMQVEGSGVSHHTGDGPDGIDYDLDADHVAFADC